MAQVTTMVLKVDLQCTKCRKKVKDVLCRFDQIQDTEYDEKQNTVTIKVICCDPEKMKYDIIRKGKGVIKCIEPKVPDKPKPPAKEEKKIVQTPGKKDDKKSIAVPANPPPHIVPVSCMPSAPLCPVPAPAGTFHRTCCGECSEGRPGGPCFDCPNIGWPPSCYQYEVYWRRQVCESYSAWYCSKPAPCHTKSCDM